MIVITGANGFIGRNILKRFDVKEPNFNRNILCMGVLTPNVDYIVIILCWKLGIITSRLMWCVNGTIAVVKYLKEIVN